MAMQASTSLFRTLFTVYWVLWYCLVQYSEAGVRGDTVHESNITVQDLDCKV